MPQKSEYKVISGKNDVDLSGKLAVDATMGWQPILMTSVATPAGIITTIVLEHKLGS